jgi:hypothetical protein
VESIGRFYAASAVWLLVSARKLGGLADAGLN